MIRRPGTGGINTDLPAWAIKQNEASRLIDGVIVEGVIRQRRGWKFGSSAVTNETTPAPFDAHGRYSFSLGDRSGTVAVRGSRIYALKNDGTWELIFDGSSLVTSTMPVPSYLPRAMYHDEVVFCSADGKWPVLRWAGAQSASANVSNAVYTAGKRIASGTTFSAEQGAFFNPAGGQQATSSLKITDYSSTQLSLDGIYIKSTATPVQPASGTTTGSIGTMWAGQDIYSPGTVSIAAGGTVTADGAVFSGTGAAWGGVFPSSGLPVLSDVLMVERMVGLTWTCHPITGIVTANTSQLTVNSSVPTASNLRYAILRRLAVQDVATRNDSLFAGGNAQYPSRVWYSPPTWNPSLPPEFGPEFDFTAQTFTGIDEFQLRWKDVPADGDGDEIVALLSSDGPLLVLKKNSAHSITGTWPNFTQTLLSNGTGCLDKRSAVDVRGFGSFWAGRAGIYAYRFGNVTDLTSARVNDEWRRRAAGFNSATGSSICAGISFGHLVVSAKITGSGVGTADEFTWICNLKSGAWSELTNIAARHMQSVRSSEGIETLLATRNYADTRAIDLSSIFTGDMANDADGHVPSLDMTMPANPEDNDPDMESRAVEATLTTRLQDATEHPAPSQVTVYVTSSGAVDQQDPHTENCGNAVATDGPALQRQRLRVGRSGRQHEMRVVATTASDNVATEIHEVGLMLRDRRPRK